MPETYLASSLPAYAALKAHHEATSQIPITAHFSDPTRFSKFSTQFKAQDTEILLDYSKNRVNAETMNLLFTLARQAKVEEWRSRMFTGEVLSE